MAEIIHHLVCKNPTNNGRSYQPQLVRRISAINSNSEFTCEKLEMGSWDGGIFFGPLLGAVSFREGILWDGHPTFNRESL